MSSDDQHSDHNSSFKLEVDLPGESSSDDELITSVKKTVNKNDTKFECSEGGVGDSPESNMVINKAKDDETKDHSEDEANVVSLDSGVAKEENASESRKRKRSTDSESSANTHSEQNESDENKNKKRRKSDSGKTSKDNSSKITRLKKYLAVAGIRIHNYSKVFEQCKSKKSKELKLLSILENEGLKGKPTIEKCKKLRKKIERRREIADLDVENIIIDNDSSTRRTRITRNRMPSKEKLKTETKFSEMAEPSELFENLSGIIDSEGSGDDKKQPAQRKKRKMYFAESD